MIDTSFVPELARTGVFKGVNLRALATYLWQLEAMRAEGPIPKVRWKASKWGQRSVAHINRGRVTMSLTSRRSVCETVEVLIHEFVHMTCPRSEHHGELFKRRLIACVREAFGLDHLDWKQLLELPNDGHLNQAYAIDTALAKAMTEAGVEERFYICFPYTAPPPVRMSVEDRAELSRIAAGKRAERNEAHARAMLAKWERKAARAKKVASKWRAKVRYYDRKAEAAGGK